MDFTTGHMRIGSVEVRAPVKIDRVAIIKSIKAHVGPTILIALLCGPEYRVVMKKGWSNAQAKLRTLRQVRQASRQLQPVVRQ